MAAAMEGDPGTEKATDSLLGKGDGAVPQVIRSQCQVFTGGSKL